MAPFRHQHPATVSSSLSTPSAPPVNTHDSTGEAVSAWASALSRSERSWRLALAQFSRKSPSKQHLHAPRCVFFMSTSPFGERAMWCCRCARGGGRENGISKLHRVGRGGNKRTGGGRRMASWRAFLPSTRCTAVTRVFLSMHFCCSRPLNDFDGPELLAWSRDKYLNVGVLIFPWPGASLSNLVCPGRRCAAAPSQTLAVHSPPRPLPQPLYPPHSLQPQP